MEQSEGGGLLDRRPEIVHVSCVCCERLHPVEHALTFNPLCPACGEGSAR